MLSALTLRLLSSILGDRLNVFNLPKPHYSRLQKISSYVRGHVDGVCDHSINTLNQLIASKGATILFLDGSNLGSLAQAISRLNPSLQIFTYFHNVESRFFFGAFRSHPSVNALGVVWANYLAESRAVKYSHKSVCLSERDSNMLKRIYGQAATTIIPMVLDDMCPPEFFTPSPLPPDSFILFVGGSFYANIQGISWFVDNVMPRIDLPLYIVGRGFEKLREELEILDNVKVVGTVESLSDWYHRAKFVIAPIFDGSGMKTKVAEALMYGKKVIGTSEAFSGYSGEVDTVGWLCNTAEDFVSSINQADRTIHSTFDSSVRAVYEQEYSTASARLKLERLFT